VDTSTTSAANQGTSGLRKHPPPLFGININYSSPHSLRHQHDDNTMIEQSSRAASTAYSATRDLPQLANTTTTWMGNYTTTQSGIGSIISPVFSRSDVMDNVSTNNSAGIAEGPGSSVVSYRSLPRMLPPLLAPRENATPHWNTCSDMDSEAISVVYSDSSRRAITVRDTTPISFSSDRTTLSRLDGRTNSITNGIVPVQDTDQDGGIYVSHCNYQ
jgi:hypothetical protein